MEKLIDKFVTLSTLEKLLVVFVTALVTGIGYSVGASIFKDGE